MPKRREAEGCRLGAPVALPRLRKVAISTHLRRTLASASPGPDGVIRAANGVPLPSGAGITFQPGHPGQPPAPAKALRTEVVRAVLPTFTPAEIGCLVLYLQHQGIPVSAASVIFAVTPNTLTQRAGRALKRYPCSELNGPCAHSRGRELYRVLCTRAAVRIVRNQEPR